MKEIKVPEVSTANETVKFEVGKVYHYSYYPNIEVVKIVNRTAKMVDVEKLSIKGDETTYRFKIKQNNDGSEYIDIKRGHITIGISAKDEYTAEMAAHMIEKYSHRNTAYLPSVMNINSMLFGNKTVTADEEVTAEVENVTANENVTAEVIAEDDKLVDTPIDTSEVQKEVKVQTSATTDTVKFEVGKIYFPCVEKPRIKITKRTAKTVHYKIERFNGEFDCETRANIQILGGSERFYSSYLYRSYYALDEEETEMKENTEITAEVIADENVTKDKEVTADEEITAETENVTAENNVEIEKLEKKLASLKLFPLNTDEYMQACVYSIKKHYACIAKAEEDMWKFQLEKEKYEREVAELENEIANRKFIAAIDDIGGSADAVDASVAAMIELNAANDFTAAKLLDAVNAADKAVENAVTFEIQNFAADVNIAEGVATINTAVSGTVIPVIDETAAIDSKVNRLRAEYADLEAQICELRKKQLAISREFSDLTYENESEVSQRLHAPALAKNLFEHGLMIYPQKGEWRRDYIWVENDIEWQELKIGTAKSVDGGYKFVTNDADGYEKEEIAVYSTLTQFKAVAEKFMAAIERGDKTFTFPADIPPATELPDSDAEIAKQIRF